MTCGKYLNRKTLIAGEVNSGKTERTLEILRELIKCQGGGVAVLDLAPEKVRGVGGKMPLTSQEKENIRYLSPRIDPPRLLGKDEEEVRRLARENRRRIEQVLEGLRGREFSALIINDVSLYLHDGDAGSLLSYVEGIPTLIMNGYYGTYFGNSALSLRERAQMEVLMSRCDQVFFLEPVTQASP